MNKMELKQKEVMDYLKNNGVNIYSAEMWIYTRPKELSCFQKNSYLIIETRDQNIIDLLLKKYPDSKDYGFSKDRCAIIYD